MISSNYYVVQFLHSVGSQCSPVFRCYAEVRGARATACQGIGSQSQPSGTEFQSLIFIFSQACDGLTLFHQRGNCLFLWIFDVITSWYVLFCSPLVRQKAGSGGGGLRSEEAALYITLHISMARCGRHLRTAGALSSELQIVKWRYHYVNMTLWHYGIVKLWHVIVLIHRW